MKQRNIHKSFFSLFIGQRFFVGRKKLAVKRGLFSCQVIGGTIQMVPPWRKVRTTTPVKPLPPSDFNEWGPTGPLSNPGKTHYVGDDCPGSHRELAGPIGHPGIEKPADRDVTGRHLRDPMDQDHTPPPQEEYYQNRTL